MSGSSSRRVSPRTKRIIVRASALFFLAVGALVTYLGGREVLRARESVNWPTAPGTVKVSAMVQSDGIVRSRGRIRRTTYARARLEYEFEVRGTAFHGARVGYGDHSSTQMSPAKEILDRYPAGARVTVYYMPEDPRECLLEPGLKGRAWVIPGFGMVLAAAGCLMMVLLPGMVKK